MAIICSINVLLDIFSALKKSKLELIQYNYDIHVNVNYNQSKQYYQVPFPKADHIQWKTKLSSDNVILRLWLSEIV
jgi:hypothetical protein